MASSNLVPFDALRNEHGKYVLETHVVTYAPSATVLYLLKERRSSERPIRDFLGVGGVVYSDASAINNGDASTPPKRRR